MKEISEFDKKISEKVYKKLVDAGYTKYTEISLIMDVSDSFVKAVFSEKRKKLNLYHLLKIKYAINCSFDDFIPSLEDYKSSYPDIDSEFEGFIKSLEGGLLDE